MIVINKGIVFSRVWGSVVKNLPASVGDTGLTPWVRKIPGRRKWQPTPVFLPGNPMDRGAWRTSVHGISKSRTWLSEWAQGSEPPPREKRRTPKNSLGTEIKLSTSGEPGPADIHLWVPSVSMLRSSLPWAPPVAPFPTSPKQAFPYYSRKQPQGGPFFLSLNPNSWWQIHSKQGLSQDIRKSNCYEKGWFSLFLWVVGLSFIF